MIIKPRYKGFICTTAHPDGCRLNVLDQIGYVKKKGAIDGPKRVLVIGASMGYGLASRISLAYGAGAKTIGVYFEKPQAGGKTGSAGWYNSAAFEEQSNRDGLLAAGINGDAYSKEVKEQTMESIRSLMPEGKVDAVIYSLASPKRKDPDSEQVYSSVIKPIGNTFTGKTVNFHTGIVSDISIAPADENEIRETVAVMGGEDWKLWLKALYDGGLLADGLLTMAFSYIGPGLTQAVYRDGTIGRAKVDLELKSKEIDQMLSDIGGKSYIAVNKAVVTQSSSAIPVVPLYMSLLFKVMKEKGLHENCIEQIYRLFKEKVYNGKSIQTDESGKLRADDLEMREDVQAEVARLWGETNSENIYEISDLPGFRKEFFSLFGFERDEIDYDADVELEELL